MAQLLVVILNKPEHLPKILDTWQGIGIPNATILDSASGRRTKSWLQRAGLSAIGSLLHTHEIKNKTLLVIIEEDELLEKAITATEEITGDLDMPSQGLLFTLPLNQVRGLQKAASQAAKRPPSTGPLTSAQVKSGQITRTTPVAVVDQILKLQPIIVQSSADLIDVAEAMIQNPTVNTACVVNSRQRLVGLLPLLALADDLFMEVIPEEYLSATGGREQALHFADISRTKTAGDAMIPSVSVTNEDTVRDAFHQMHSHQLSGIPIIDDQHHVTGYINLLELLSLIRNSQQP